MNTLGKRTSEERFNTLTHLGGVVFTLAAAWVILRLGWGSGWKNAFGTTFFTCGMLLMYAASTLYHWWLPGHGKRRLRVLDHISIYVMIAASYTPICIGVVGGALGWTVFGLLWAVRCTKSLPWGAGRACRCSSIWLWVGPLCSLPNPCAHVSQRPPS